MFDLTGRIALVTGGNGGIGLGMARGPGEAGATVIIVARNAEKSAAALRDLQAAGVRAESVPCDVTDEAAVQRLFAQVDERHGRLDILVNNAGSTVRNAPQDFSLDEWPSCRWSARPMRRPIAPARAASCSSPSRWHWPGRRTIQANAVLPGWIEPR